MNAALTKLQEQPSGARRLALFAAKTTAIWLVGCRRTSDRRPRQSALAIGALAIGRLVLKRLIVDVFAHPLARDR